MNQGTSSPRARYRHLESWLVKSALFRSSTKAYKLFSCKTDARFTPHPYFKLASLQVLQQLFTVFTGINNVNNSTLVGASNVTASGVSPLTIPTDLSSLLAFLFSFSSLRDWLKLIVIGGVVETSRRLSISAYHNLIEALWLTAYFDEDDYSYGPSFLALCLLWCLLTVVSDWMMVWLAKQPSWCKFRIRSSLQS
jgi:hypothetical protein